MITTLGEIYCSRTFRGISRIILHAARSPCAKSGIAFAAVAASLSASSFSGNSSASRPTVVIPVRAVPALGFITCEQDAHMITLSVVYLCPKVDLRASLHCSRTFRGIFRPALPAARSSRALGGIAFPAVAALQSANRPTLVVPSAAGALGLFTWRRKPKSRTWRRACCWVGCRRT